MANKLKETKPGQQTEPSVKNRSTKKNSLFAKWMNYVFSGDFLFSKNFRRSPFWFVLYVVLLILIYIGMRYEPVKRYYAMRRLNTELVEKFYRNNELKAQLQYYQSAGNLMKQISKDGFIIDSVRPIIIKVKSNGRDQ